MCYEAIEEAGLRFEYNPQRPCTCVCFSLFVLLIPVSTIHCKKTYRKNYRQHCVAISVIVLVL